MNDTATEKLVRQVVEGIERGDFTLNWFIHELDKSIFNLFISQQASKYFSKKGTV